MADNYLITGYHGTPHVTSENDRGINAGIFGAGRFVLPVGEQFRAEYIGNNTVRMYDGKLIDNGAVAGIPAGEHVDLTISNAGQGMKRNDLIVFQYSKDASTLVETGTFTVLRGTEVSGTATDPALTQEDILSGNAATDQMVLWRVPVSGTTVSAPEQVFVVAKNFQNLKPSDIGASASGHTHTPASIGAASADHTHTPESIGAQPKLKFTPVQQGGGANQQDNKVYIGWSNEAKLNVQVDTLNLGNIITDSDNYPVVLPVSKGGTGARNAADARSILGAQKDLGYTPVKQGGGNGQGANAVYIGWATDASGLKAQVESSDLGHIITTKGNCPALPVSRGGTGAKTAADARTNLGVPSKITKTLLWGGNAGNGVTVSLTQSIGNFDMFFVAFEGAFSGMQYVDLACGWYGFGFDIVDDNKNTVTYACKVEVLNDGLQIKNTKCSRITHTPGGNHNAAADTFISAIYGIKLG